MLLHRPLYSLRPYGFAVGWLLLFELVLRLTCTPDPRVLRAPLRPYGCSGDAELEEIVNARTKLALGPTLDVVLIGDSVLGSVNNRPGDRLRDLLGPNLRQKLGADQAATIRVFDLSVGGARAADVYAALRRLQQRLDAASAGPSEAHKLVVVLSSNVIFFSQRHRQPAILAPCLLDDLQAGDELRHRLSLPAAAPPLEKRLTAFVTEHLYLFQQRRRIAEALFGGPPRIAVRERLQHLHSRRQKGGQARPAYDDRSWQEHHLHAEQYAPQYELVPLDAKDALNYQMTVALADWLAAHRELRALVVFTPQNHALLGKIADTAEYHALYAHLEELFRRHAVPFVSYDRNPAIRSAMFSDLDHLTMAGNHALAELLAADLVPLTK